MISFDNALTVIDTHVALMKTLLKRKKKSNELLNFTFYHS